MKKSVIHIEVPRQLKAQLVRLAKDSKHKKLQPYLISQLEQIVLQYDEDELELAIACLGFSQIPDYYSVVCMACIKPSIRIFWDGNKNYLCGSCLIDKAIKES